MQLLRGGVVPRVALMLTFALGVNTMACSEPFAPAAVAGTYGWSGGVEVQLPSGRLARTVADTFVLRADRSAVRRTYTEHLAQGAVPAVIIRQEMLLSYRVNGRAIGFSSTCPIGANCAAIASTPLWYDLWTIESFVSRDHPRLVYERRGAATAP